MAKNRRSKAQRGANVSPLDDGLLSPLSPDFSQDLLPVEDRRQYHPLGDLAPARTTSGTRSRFQLVDPKPTPRQKATGFRPYVQTQARIGFAVPDSVVVCVRRKTRREVLFAKRRTGGRGRRHRNWTTFISCR